MLKKLKWKGSTIKTDKEVPKRTVEGKKRTFL
jgi:hypothetical protein